MTAATRKLATWAAFREALAAVAAHDPGRALAWLDQATAGLRALAGELAAEREASEPTAAQSRCFE